MCWSPLTPIHPNKPTTQPVPPPLAHRLLFLPSNRSHRLTIASLLRLPPVRVCAADLPALYTEYGHSDWAQQLRAAATSMNRSLAPLVPTFCFYGLGLATTFAYTFAGPIISEAYVSVQFVDGDGNQDYVDNTFCNIWAAQQQAAGIAFEAQAFEGVEHMSMVTDPKVMVAVHAALQQLAGTGGSQQP
jgi:hypothetical protein